MRLRNLIVMLFMLLPLTVHAIDALPFKDRAQELRFQALTKQLRCMVCQNESLADSTADLARDLRNDIFQQMQNGKSDRQIKDYLTARYSNFVLYDPPLNPGTWLLWFGPGLLLLIGAGSVAAIVRRRSRDATLAAANTHTEDDW
jgi:cytochrome c-type biogenesis protein CcmH